jgi:hypothetical protein
MEHAFTKVILETLRMEFGEIAGDIFDKSQLIQYLNFKTRSAQLGSKARGSFASLYAIYVLVEDYLKGGYDKKPGYREYEGAKFIEFFCALYRYL